MVRNDIARGVGCLRVAIPTVTTASLLLLCALGITSAWGADDYRSLSIPWSNDNPITIGSGIDIDLINQQRYTCLDVTEAEMKWLDGSGAVKTDATIELVSDYKSLAKTLNLEVDYKSKADAGIAALKAGGSVDLNVKYDSFAKDENRTLAIVLKAYSDFGRKGLITFPLKKEFAALVSSGKFSEFRERCGTHTVVGQHNEAMVAAVILLSDLSSTSKHTLEAMYHSTIHAKGSLNAAEFSGSAESTARWKNIIESASRLGTMKLSFESRGGAGVPDALKAVVSTDPTRIDHILSELTKIGPSFNQASSAPVKYLLVSNNVFGVKSKISDPSKLEVLNGYYLQLARVDDALSRIRGYETNFPALYKAYGNSQPVLNLRSYRSQLIGAIEACVLQDTCNYKPPKSLGVLFAEDILLPESITLQCHYRRFDTPDGKLGLNVLDNIAVVLRGRARLTEFVSLPTAVLSRLGPDSTPPRKMVTSWQAFSMSDIKSDGTARILAQIDNQTIKPDVSISAGNITITNESELARLLNDILGSIYTVSMQATNGLYIKNAVGPAFGGQCPLKKGVGTL